MKRFTEALKWRDPWFLDLSYDAKLAFFYLVDNCDAAGVWEPNFRLANFSLKRDVPWNEVKSEFGDRLAVLPSGYWWLTRFVYFQYGRLSETCPPHRPIISLVNKHKLQLEKGIVSLTLEYRKGIDTLEEKEKDQDQGKECEKGDAGILSLGLEPDPDLFPSCLRSDAFRVAWSDWLAYRKERRLKAYVKRGEQAQLSRLAEWGESRAIDAIRFSMGQNYQGIYENARTGINGHAAPTPTAFVEPTNQRQMFGR